jgi:eukaryotic-like serine/threonine-protein kinase
MPARRIAPQRGNRLREPGDRATVPCDAWSTLVSLVPGMVVANRFELESQAGEGGMGAVWRARDRATGVTIALKLLHEHDARHAERLAREARTLAELTHPGIVRYVAHGVARDGATYMAMEWLEGEDLAGRLLQGPLPIRDCIVLAHRVADALAAAHARGIVHRDIKPGNIFLRDGQVDRAVLLDFGIARLTAATRQLTGTGTVVGTPGYMAPEQARGARHVEPTVDVFALGCVLYECLTGEPAFVGEHVMAVLARILLDEPEPVERRRTDVPAPLAALLARMLAKDPATRPRDGAALARELALQAEQAVAPVIPTAALTTTEQRVFSVVLVGGPRQAGATVHSRPTTEGEERAWLESLEAAVGAHGGRLERIAGGGLLVLLSGTGAATDQAAQAARCALAVHALVPDRMVALATGRGQFADRWPVGPVIDRAVRLAADASIGIATVTIDDVTAGLLGPRFSIETLDGARHLAGERELDEGTRTLLGRPTPCVGRQHELELLESTFEQCAEERVARAILVTAPPGVGKSRLRHEFLARIGARGAVEVLVARGDPISAGSPFALLAPSLRRAARVRDGEPLPLRQQRLRTRIARHVPAAELVRVTEFLGELTQIPFPDAGSLPLRTARQDPRVMGDQIRRAWEDWLAAECAAQPVALVLEDLHWGDLPSITLVDAALRNLADRPLLVLALARPEVNATFPGLWAQRSVHELRLAELTPRAAEQLVREVLGAAVPAATVAHLVAQAAGNAFFLEELIRCVAEGRTELPDGVLGMVESRLEALDAESRRVLRAASVFGETFWSGAVAGLLGTTAMPGVVDGRLGGLVQSELVTRRPEARFPGVAEFTFRHGLVRDAAYAMLTGQDRVLGHRLAAEWLERAGERNALVLAEHFERGGEAVRAVPYWLRATQQAFEGNDLAAAIARAERGMACGAQGVQAGELRRWQADAHAWRAEFELARARAREAVALLPRDGVSIFRAQPLLAWAASAAGRQDEAIAAAEDLLARDPPVPEQLIQLAHNVPLLGRAGRYDLMDTTVERLDAYIADHPEIDPPLVALTHYARAGREAHHGRVGRVAHELTRAIESFEQSGDVLNACLAGAILAYQELQIGRYASCIHRVQSILTAAERLGIDALVVNLTENHGRALLALGQLDEAEALMRRSLAVYESRDSHLGRGLMHVYLALVAIERGESEAARDLADRAVDFLATQPPFHAYALAVRSWAARLLGRTLEALEDARRAREILRSLGHVEEGDALIRLEWAEALHAAGDAAGAREAIRSARDDLMERARSIDDPEVRQGFLTGVPENASTLARAREWLGAEVPAGDPSSTSA